MKNISFTILALALSVPLRVFADGDAGNRIVPFDHVLGNQGDSNFISGVKVDQITTDVNGPAVPPQILFFPISRLNAPSSLMLQFFDPQYVWLPHCKNAVLFGIDRPETVQDVIDFGPYGDRSEKASIAVQVTLNLNWSRAPNHYVQSFTASNPKVLLPTSAQQPN